MKGGEMRSNVRFPGQQSRTSGVIPPFAIDWARGEQLVGVTFSPAMHVRLLGGSFINECASVRALVSLEPEPCYRVEIDAAHVSLEIPQSSLERA
jgi:hypothetical protein